MFPTDKDFEAKFSLETEKTGIIEEPPFHFLILGDWSGDGQKKDLNERRPVEINRDNFDEILGKLNVRLKLDLQDDGNPLLLHFRELDDFHPDNIFGQIPLFSELRDLRRRLSKADTFNSAAREVRASFELSDSEKIVEKSDSSAENAVSESDNLLDQILSGNSGSVRVQSTHSIELNNLLRDLVKPHLVGFDEAEQSKLIAAVDEANSNLMRKILHHPKFQELESAWRGLYFLVKRTETDTDLKIFILNVSKDELSENLKSVNNLADSALYRQLVLSKNESGEKSWSFFCGNYAFDSTVEDIAILMRLSKLANTADAPFISYLRPQIFGIESSAQLLESSDWNFSEETAEGKLWNALRSLPESEFLGLATPRFLARLPYGAETEPLENFSFEEMPGQPTHEQYLWINPSFAVSVLLAESYRIYGWKMGRALKQNIENLPIHIYKVDGETITKSCAEVIFTQTVCEKLIEFGLMPLISFRNTDRVRLGIFQSISSSNPILQAKWN